MQRRQIMKAGGAIAASLSFPSISRAASAYKAEYKMSTVVPPSFAWGKGAEIFADLVRERTSGRINIKQYSGASLVQGMQEREFSAMRQGIVDVLCGAPVSWAGTVRQLGVFTLPFLIPSQKVWDTVTTTPAIVDDFFDLVRKSGAEPLALGVTGFRQITNSKRPIRSPEDMKGLKVRVSGSPMYGEIMSNLTANPTFMTWADAQPALATGAVDAQENSIEVFVKGKLYTLDQKFMTNWNYSNDVLLFAISAPIFSSWTQEDQKIVREAAQDAAKEQINMVRKLQTDGIDTVRALGVEVYEPTPSELAKWRSATMPTYEKWKKATHPGLVKKIEQVVAEAL